MRLSSSLTAGILFLTLAVAAPPPPPPADADGWASLFDGKSLEGWKAAETPAAFKVEGGALVVGGAARGHLFYDGPVRDHDFKNFEFKAEVKVAPGSNSGIYFHTRFQHKGWPNDGFECQVNNTYKDPKKTGSLYGVKNVAASPVKDEEWFEYHIAVTGKRVVIKINGETTADFTQPDDYKPTGFPGRILSRGTFALQAHDPKSVAYYRSIRVKPLPD
ncbi:MAG: DUF1080 domain-containing protein [Isosphaera sp.]|nr:DUF1080 domain-containing protein [Isosphaera sp.]